MEIREVLSGKFQDSELQSGILQKRINLPDGKRFKILSIECFDDNMGILAANTENVNVTREIYVTPFPITPTNQPFGFTNSMRLATNQPGNGMGMFAGDNACLYKRLDWTKGDANDVGAPQANTYSIDGFEFPNPMTANNTPFSWYSPHLYLTCKMNWSEARRAVPIAISFYIKYEMVNADSTQYAMGIYKETLEAQARTVSRTVVSIDSEFSAGRNFPSWKFGGARSEIMVSSANVLRYFDKLAARDVQDMDQIVNFRTRFKEATTMVGYDSAFGDTVTNIPDWITLMDVAGVTSGPIRSFPPPQKFTGNGNTVMYDGVGNPASIVT